MGATELSRAETLLRETVQNTWDARLPGVRPEYGITARFLAAPAMRTLREQIFRDLPRTSPLESSLRKDNLAAVEIYDRGTSGLDGPLDPSSHQVDSSRSNFVKLIYDIGSTKPAGTGSGGTYGFGKTAAFTASSSRTVLYWTVCRSTDGLEHRLIAVCHGTEYSEDRLRYTGVHWWGSKAAKSDVVLPVTGNAARYLGERLFERHFREGETGTSILVLDPYLDFSVAESTQDEETVEDGLSLVTSRAHLRSLQEQFTSASVKYTWPKITVSPVTGTAPMALYIGREQDPDPEEQRGVPDLRPHKRLLNELRHYQERGTSRTEEQTITEDGLLMQVTCRAMQKRWGGKSAYYGDIAVAKVVGYEKAGEDLSAWVTDRLCNMRHEAELVVNYLDVSGIEAEGFHWFAVFKPRATFDQHFADSEPPAHDRWLVGGSLSPEAAATVSSAQRLVPHWVRKILAPKISGKGVEGESAVSVAEELNSFVPFAPVPAEGRGESGRTSRSPRRGRSQRESVEIVRATSERTSDERHRYKLDLMIGHGAGGPVTVRLRVKARIGGGNEDFDPGDVHICWVNRREVEEASISEVEAAPGEQLQVLVYVPKDSALDLDLSGEVTSV